MTRIDVPAGKGSPALGASPIVPRFVVHEHHARSLHWDFRLEHGDVLASWAVPKGVPLQAGVRRLAVATPDHPLDYVDFEGTIPAGEYGAGKVEIWDEGEYDAEKYDAREIVVHLHGHRLNGRYALVRMRDRNWLLQRVREAS